MMVKQQRMMVPGHGERGSPKIDRYGFGAYFKQDNEFICGSYRCGQSVRDALRSVFAGHNEILNVWKDKVKKKKKRLLEE
ncbi:heptahelical transmembrane protein 2-like isoform X3 [Aegilops tauschii subsp. strangulata]|uniref:heptahelical transmembrane protein 2-like isoform X3 n=1 Tax=Aegilops tauschii subsp. strangulata TaxID=200361 RepID=UPI001ABC1CC4|nr:heptahelical transmembrane protein 2-like isoform X3 [Aegilops tauschii subsp. strangulata]